MYYRLLCRPGEKWLRGFNRRHPELANRKDYVSKTKLESPNPTHGGLWEDLFHAGDFRNPRAISAPRRRRAKRKRRSKCLQAIFFKGSVPPSNEFPLYFFLG